MPKHVAFFGATGGCALSCLVQTLNANHTVTALARHPDKLKEALRLRGIEVEKAGVRIVQGHIRQSDAVKDTLLIGGAGADVVICGIGKSLQLTLARLGLMGPGAPPKPQMSLKKPLTTEDPKLYEASTKSILKAVTELGIHPLLGIISATGVSSSYRDIPYALYPMYKWLISGPFDDKRAAYDALNNSNERWVSIRPSILTNGPAKGLSRVREGLDDKAALGYVISREDVGLWMFERLVNGDAGGYIGHKISITY